MIHIRDLYFSYGRKRWLFNDLSLDLEPGNIYGLLGQNGAGKTTLLKLMMGLLFPQSGHCQVYGYEAAQRDPNMLRDIYIIPEEFHLPGISIRDYLEINSVFYPRFSQDQFDEYMNEFRLDPGQKLTALSYGQKKKFLLAFGLATRSRLLILDEPTNGLDIPSKSQFRRIVAPSITEEQTFIISTHQVRDLESLIDPVIILEDGKIIFNQPAEAISRKLAFKILKEEQEERPMLYTEELVNGKAAIVSNDGSEETHIDLELLFNGVVNKTDAINRAFHNGSSGQNG